MRCNALQVAASFEALGCAARLANALAADGSKYRGGRPGVGPREDPRAWWRYAVRHILLEIRALRPATAPNLALLRRAAVQAEPQGHRALLLGHALDSLAAATAESLGPLVYWLQQLFMARSGPAAGMSVGPFLNVEVSISGLRAALGNIYASVRPVAAAAALDLASGQIESSSCSLGPLHLRDAQQGRGQESSPAISAQSCSDGPMVSFLLESGGRGRVSVSPLSVDMEAASLPSLLNPWLILVHEASTGRETLRQTVLRAAAAAGMKLAPPPPPLPAIQSLEIGIQQLSVYLGQQRSFGGGLELSVRDIRVRFGAGLAPLQQQLEKGLPPCDRLGIEPEGPESGRPASTPLEQGLCHPEVRLRAATSPFHASRWLAVQGRMQAAVDGETVLEEQEFAVSLGLAASTTAQVPSAGMVMLALQLPGAAAVHATPGHLVAMVRIAAAAADVDLARLEEAARLAAEDITRVIGEIVLWLAVPGHSAYSRPGSGLVSGIEGVPFRRARKEDPPGARPLLPLLCLSIRAPMLGVRLAVDERTKGHLRLSSQDAALGDLHASAQVESMALQVLVREDRSGQMAGSVRSWSVNTNYGYLRKHARLAATPVPLLQSEPIEGHASSLDIQGNFSDRPLPATHTQTLGVALVQVTALSCQIRLDGIRARASLEELLQLADLGLAAGNLLRANLAEVQTLHGQDDGPLVPSAREEDTEVQGRILAVRDVSLVLVSEPLLVLEVWVQGEGLAEFQLTDTRIEAHLGSLEGLGPTDCQLGIAPDLLGTHLPPLGLSLEARLYRVDGRDMLSGQTFLTAAHSGPQPEIQVHLALGCGMDHGLHVQLNSPRLVVLLR